MIAFRNQWMQTGKVFRRSWFHARDYGLLVANAFGRNAITKSEKSKITIAKEETFRLRFGMLIYHIPMDSPVQAEPAYREFIQAKADGTKVTP